MYNIVFLSVICVMFDNDEINNTYKFRAGDIKDEEQAFCFLMCYPLFCGNMTGDLMSHIICGVGMCVVYLIRYVMCETAFWIWRW